MRRLDELIQDLRLALRTTIRDPGFALTAIAVLAAGIGLAVATFSIANTVLRRPLPIHDQDRVVVLWGAADRQRAVSAAHSSTTSIAFAGSARRSRQWPAP